MTNWELARYLIDAEKCVDSVLFIAENVKDLRNLSLRDIVEDRKRKFYINVKIIYDAKFTRNQQRSLAQTDEVFEQTCLERNKNYAHKDPNYEAPDCESLVEMAGVLKERLIHCLNICRSVLPNQITLDFIDYDHDLYRFLKKIDPKKEERILKAQHPRYGFAPSKEDLKNSVSRKIFSDTEDLKKLDKHADYAVVIKAGLTVRESVHELQDGCIRINVLNNQNMWAVPNMNVMEKMRRMIEENPDLPFLW